MLDWILFIWLRLYLSRPELATEYFLGQLCVARLVLSIGPGMKINKPGAATDEEKED